MPIPAIVGVGAATSGAASVTPAYPGGYTAIAGHIACTLVECESADTIVPPTNWALAIAANVSTGTTTKLSALWRRLTAAEAAPTIADAGDHMTAQMIVLSGCASTGNPYDQAVQTTELVADTTVSIAGVTTGVADCLMLYAFSTGQDIASTAGATGWADASLANVAERMDIWAVAGLGGGFGMATGEKAVAGATGAMTATLSLAANFKGQIVIAFKGEPAPVFTSRGNRSRPNRRR
jgi:hypothetical protein